MDDGASRTLDERRQRPRALPRYWRDTDIQVEQTLGSTSTVGSIPYTGRLNFGKEYPRSRIHSIRDRRRRLCRQSLGSEANQGDTTARRELSYVIAISDRPLAEASPQSEPQRGSEAQPKASRASEVEAAEAKGTHESEAERSDKWEQAEQSRDDARERAESKTTRSDRADSMLGTDKMQMTKTVASEAANDT